MGETWVQYTVVGVFLSCVWGWMDAGVVSNEAMDCLVDVFVSNV